VRPGETTARRVVLRRIDTRKVQLSSSRNDSASVMKRPFSQRGINREKNGKEGKVGTRDYRENQLQIQSKEPFTTCNPGISIAPSLVPEVFLACGGNFRCRPKAEATSGEAARKTAGHYKDLTETGNRARKVSGHQGILQPKQLNLVLRSSQLTRKAAELQRKEQELQRMQFGGYRENNFPPLPSKCPYKPCFFHDISIDIPIQYQRTCKLLFYRWQG
ncbi:unnamed protein product, partial [Porites evermanni]